MPRIHLRHLILALTCGSVLLVVTVFFLVSWKTQRDLLIQSSLEANRLYAMKIARSADELLDTTQERLRYAGAEIAESWDDPTEQAAVIRRLHRDSGLFNSVIIVDKRGVVRRAEPHGLGLEGVALNTAGAKAALQAQAPLISHPFSGATGNLVTTISSPVRNAQGEYLGFVSGAIYLQKQNILHSLLGEHDFRDGSYLYVVDSDGRIIYHQDPHRIGEQVIGNAAIDAVVSGHVGSMQLHNSRGLEVLAGYAPVDGSGWGVVAQQPLAATLSSLNDLMWKTMQYTLPGVILVFVLIWFFSAYISSPLSQLATRARRMDESGTRQALQDVNSWYYEAAQLKASLMVGLGEMDKKLNRLREESHTDQLTGLANRREMTAAIAVWQARRVPFSVIVFDIDHFKKINDQYGHDVGDDVLRQMADVMRGNSRSMDLLCRPGGDEFAIFLPDSTIVLGYEVAERLRQAAHRQIQAGGLHVTISCGVAHVPGTSADLDTAMKAADVALYSAKAEGRNRTVMAERSEQAVADVS